MLLEEGTSAPVSGAPAEEVEPNLQQESYHEPETPIVATTASSERAVVTEEDVKGGDGAVLTALELWCARRGPVKFNVWQSAFFAMIKGGLQDERTVPGESRMDKARRIKDMYNTIQEQIHGEDHLAQAVLRDRDRGTARGEGNQQQQRIGSLPKLSEMRSLPRLSERELRALCKSQEIQEFPESFREPVRETAYRAVGQIPSRSAARGLHDRSQFQTGTEEYAVFTPRGMHKAPSVDSPDKFALREGVEQVWNEEEAPATDATGGAG
jgi:hypothetical protein